MQPRWHSGGRPRSQTAAGLSEGIILVARGFPDQEVSARPGVSRNTIRNHVSATYREAGVHRRGALVGWAGERGFGVPKTCRQNSAEPDGDPKHRSGLTPD